MFFLTGLWGSIGPGIVAGIIIVLWDLARILVQSKWLIKKLNQKSSCPHCQELAGSIKSIAKKLGVDDDSGHSRTD